MRVLELISSGGFYGAESVLLTLSRGLNELGCEVVVGVFENEHIPNLEIAERARQARLPVELFPCRGRFDRNAVRALRNFARDRGVDLVHTHGYKADIYGYAAFHGSKIPLTGTCHNWTNQSRSLRIYAHLDRFALCRFSRVIAVSDTVQQKLLASGMQQERLVTIENGVDLGRFLPKPSSYAAEIGKGNRKLIGMIGRLVLQKGPDLLLRAAQGVFQRFPDTAIVFIGDGPMQAELESLAKELGIADRVIFAGSRSDVPDICQALDMVVLPSLNEGLPMSLLEALAAERPTIATRVGGVPRIIRDNETGLLIEPGDTAGLRIAMERMLSDPALAARLARAGRTLVEEQFSAQAMARKYLNVFEELAPERASAKQHASGPARAAEIPAERISELSSADNFVKVSIIIPARNEEKFLAQCLNSLTRLKYPRGAFEVILVDNGSQDRTIEIAQQFASALPLRILQKPGVHISELRNVGAADATGDVFAFLDADCTVSEDWLFGVAAALRDESTGVAGAEMLMPSNASWVSRIWFWKGKEKRGEVGYVGTANLSVRRDVFLRAGGYDGSLETNEDCEFCFRVQAAGFKILAIPKIAVVHLRVPVKLSDFYRKQRWHGTHTFRVFLRNLPSLANVRAVVFAIWTLAAIFGLFAGVALALAGWGSILLLGSAVAMLIPPVLLSAQGIRNGKPLKHLPAMLLLYLTYGIARASCLLDLKNWIGHGEQPPRVTKPAGSTSA